MNILIFGAHPDDCDLCFGGFALKYTQLGHNVKFVSMTNGDTGHYELGGGKLARTRYAEAQAAASIGGIYEYEFYDIHNNQLMPDWNTRMRVIGTIRQFKADMVFCHRSNDYHPDHRAVGLLVQDSIYAIGIPNVLPLTEPLRTPPVMGYLYDNFTEPSPYRPDVAIDVEDVFETKVDMLCCHTSQMFEWLPWDRNELDLVPPADDPAARRTYVKEQMATRYGGQADGLRNRLIKLYGEDRGKAIKYAEAVMISEYGHRPTKDEMKHYFPFFNEDTDLMWG